VTARVRLSVPDRALGGVTETLLRLGVAAAVLEHLGEAAELALVVDDGPHIHLVPGPQVDRRAADGLVSALDAWLDGVLGPTAQPRRARVELEIAVRPQLPQGNPQVRRLSTVTPVTVWG
jgi:hypothetical protein